MSAKVLIVDDSALARRTMRVALEAEGHSVEEAADGEQALERYFLAPPDLVILDMVMKGMPGLEVLAKLREVNPGVKVIVATADIQNSTASDVRSAGAQGLLNKPINRQVLATCVNSILAGGQTWN